MIRSMTGYGFGELEHEGQRLTAEIRSVNHRFCEVSLRAPKLVSLFEDARVEALAIRRFPGLRRLWAPFHDAGTPTRLPSLSALLARLLSTNSPCST